ncbi:MAG: hypothetical protein ACLP8A_13760, partial [Methylovirgula sp.]
MRTKLAQGSHFCMPQPWPSCAKFDDQIDTECADTPTTPPKNENREEGSSLQASLVTSNRKQGNFEMRISATTEIDGG